MSDDGSLLLENAEVQRRLDAISELSKHGQVLLFTLNIVSFYVVLSLASIQLSNGLRQALDHVFSHYREVSNLTQFQESLHQSDLPGWDWIQQFTISQEINRLSMVDNAERMLQCKRHVSMTPDYARSACESIFKFYRIRDSAIESPIKIETPLLKGEFPAMKFLLVSVVILIAIYWYMIYSVSNLTEMLEDLELMFGDGAVRLKK